MDQSHSWDAGEEETEPGAHKPPSPPLPRLRLGTGSAPVYRQRDRDPGVATCRRSTSQMEEPGFEPEKSSHRELLSFKTESGEHPALYQ